MLDNRSSASAGLEPGGAWEQSLLAMIDAGRRREGTARSGAALTTIP
jgi:hypothetical protein